MIRTFVVSIGSQMWALGCLLLLIAGQYAPDGDMMLEITDYLLAPEVTLDEAAYVKVLIENHHTAFVQPYPEASVIPKMRYLTHMPRLITR